MDRKLEKTFGEILEEILEGIFPSSIYCLCCGNIIDRTRAYSICDRCIRDMRWNVGRTCGRCGKMLEDTWHREICADCMKIEHYFQKGYSCCQYGNHARSIIFSYKYSNKNYIGRFMGQAMGDMLKGVGDGWDYLVPVPTEKEKEQERGFDHTYLLARETGKVLGIKAIPALLRTKKTIPQRGLDPVSRRANVQGAMELDDYYGTAIQGKHLLLIDDIYTTGATVDECSRVLLEEGAARVDVAAFAAGGNRHNQPED